MILVLTGAPGSGKGTQSDLLVDRAGFSKISTGDVLRQNIKNQTPLGKIAESTMARGELVADNLMLDLLKVELTKLGVKRVLLDGFPRTISQAEGLEKLGGEVAVSGVVNLSVPTSSLVSRLSGRRVCTGCGRSYHTSFAPTRVVGICDACGERTIQRPDDQDDRIKTRLDVYRDSTQPLLSFYRSKGLLKEIEGEGTTEAVYARLSKVLDELGFI